jgi:hypothetical protein
MKTERAYFKVVGMYCTSCKLIIEKQWKKKIKDRSNSNE